MKPLVSFLLATLNRKQDLKESLDKIYQQNYQDIEVIVVDNGSNDGTGQIIKRYKNLKYIKLDKNIGAIAARTLAYSKCSGKYVISVDDDSFPGKNSISKMVEIFENNKDIGLISFKILNYNENINNYENIYFENSELYENNHWSGCGGGFRKTIFNKLGPWEEWGAESPFELTTSAKAIKLGYKCVSCANIFVLHKWSSYGDPANFRIHDMAFYAGIRGFFLFMFKFSPYNLNFFNTLIKLLFLAIYDAIVKKRLLILRAVIEAISLFKNIRKERMPVSGKQILELMPARNFLGK